MPPPWLNVTITYFFSVSSLTVVMGLTLCKRFQFCLVSPQNILLKVLGVLAGQAFVSSFRQFWKENEAHSVLKVVLSSFVTSSMPSDCALGVILVACPIVGRFATVPCFLHLNSCSDRCCLHYFLIL